MIRRVYEKRDEDFENSRNLCTRDEDSDLASSSFTDVSKHELEFGKFLTSSTIFSEEEALCSSELIIGAGIGDSFFFFNHSVIIDCFFDIMEET